MIEINYQWENFTHPKVVELRERYKLEEVINAGRGEFEKQLLLKDWVNRTLPLGQNPKRQYENALEILGDAKDGQFFCSHYTLTFIQAGIAMGWYTRKLGIDYDHKQGEEEKHHGIADIWSNQFGKWYVVDAMHNLHFEKNGIPLNALEIRSEFLKDRAEDIIGVVGNHDKEIRYGKDTVGFDQPSNYFWFFILLRNNFFEDPDMYNSMSLLWSDKHNEGKIWYKGGGKKGESLPHPQYKGQFIKTSDFKLCFPSMKTNNTTP